MNRTMNVVSCGVVALVLGLVFTGCDGGDGGGGGSPAADLNATGFWENPLHGAVAAGNLTQNGGNVTGNLLLPPNGNGDIIGTVKGYHMDFTINGESGSGDFSFVDTSADKLIFTGNLPSVGDFAISWRGPDFEHHTPAEQPLGYTPSAPTW